MRCLLWPMQSTPLILLMILASVLVGAAGATSPLVALAAAVLVLGLFNGSNAGQAVAEAMLTLREERAPAKPALSAAVYRARAQMVAFIVNATRGSPAASVMGVPELLSALNDVASFSSERITTYTFLLIFYVLLVAWCIAWPTCGRRGWPSAGVPMLDMLSRFLPEFLSGLAVNFRLPFAPCWVACCWARRWRPHGFATALPRHRRPGASRCCAPCPRLS
jgi:hypothetical protein